MPDWKSEASREIEKTRFSPAEREEIASELAGYLEDSCSAATERGLDDSASTRNAIAELREDNRLGAHLYRARREGTVNDRTKQLWIPGLSLLCASAAMLALSQLAALWVYSAYAPTPHGNNFPGLMAWLMRHNSAALLVYMGWLYTLPFLGAFGAGWARRAGSSRSTQITSGLFPLVLFFAIFFGQRNVGAQSTSLPFLAMDALPPAHIFFPFMSTAVSLFLSWVVIPAVALLLGVLPFLSRSKSARMNSVISA